MATVSPVEGEICQAGQVGNASEWPDSHQNQSELWKKGTVLLQVSGEFLSLFVLQWTWREYYHLCVLQKTMLMRPLWQVIPPLNTSCCLESSQALKFLPVTFKFCDSPFWPQRCFLLTPFLPRYWYTFSCSHFYRKCYILCSQIVFQNRCSETKMSFCFIHMQILIVHVLTPDK